MATSTQDQTTYHALNDAARVHVADVRDDLTLDNADSKYIEAVVQLVWPFSSTNSQLSLLLIEKDVPLRDITAQIRVTFHGACAKEIAQSKIGIGDTLKLDLRGASAEAEHEELSTPGKKAGYDLHFRKNFNLQASTYDGKVKVLNFVSPVPPVVLNGTHFTPKTSNRNGSIDISKTRLSSTTPGSKRIPRISSNSFPGSLTDPFSEDDGYVQGYGRKRTKFARRSNQWRLADASEEESESRYEEVQDGPVLDRAATEPDVHLAPVIDLRGISSNNIPMSAAEEQEPPQASQIENHHDAEREATNLKVILIDEEEPATGVQKMELMIPDDHLPAIEIPVSTSWEPQIPVERVTPDRASTVSIQTPALTALASPGLPLISPLMFRTDGFPTISQMTSGLGTGAPTIDETSIHVPSHHVEPYDFAYVTKSVSQLEPATTEAATTSIEELQAQSTLPATIIEADEVDLDKLQEQIDMSNAEFIPEVLEQVNEDEDMYGPPRDREVGMNLQHIQEIRSRISSNEPEDLSVDPQLANLTNKPSISNDVWGSLDGGYVPPKSPTLNSASREVPFESLLPDQVAFQPYPFQFESQTEIAEQASDDVGADVKEQESMSSVPKPAMEPLQYFDGLSPLEAHEEQSSPVIEIPPTSEIDAVRTEHVPPQFETGQPPTTAVHTSASVEDTTDGSSLTYAQDSGLNFSHVDQQREKDEYEFGLRQAKQAIRETFIERESNVLMDLLTPEATQVTGTKARDDLVIDNQTHGQLPPTPIESQVGASQQHAAEDVSFNHIEGPLPDTTLLTPARSMPGRNIRDYDHGEGIESPYFTSNTPMLMPTAVMHSIKVPATSRVRLRSSSPADSRVDHLETNRLAALETSIRQNSNIPSQDQSQPEAQGGIAIPLEYYAHLDTLSEYYNQRIDVMAVCSADSVTPERAKSGPKDFFTTIHLVDHSVQEGNTAVTVQIFRPRRNAIPTTRRGDILLLRRFKVQTKSHKPMLLSTDESAWAVYQSLESSDENGVKNIRLIDTPIMTGPPVEQGPFESDNASRLHSWWLADGSKHHFEGATETSPVKAAERGVNGRPRKPPPAPIELRRSPRKTRKTASIDVDHSPTSPLFQPESPSLSHMTVPSSQSRASPQSPASVRSTRSQFSPLKSEVQSVINPPVTSPVSRQRTRAQHQSTPPSPNVENTTTLTATLPNTTPKNFSSSNSVTSSVTQTSASSKRRRYERRSTSLVHKLRDGTEWVDIEQEEIFSVTESESDGDDTDDASEQGQEVDQDQDQDRDQPHTDTTRTETIAHEAPKSPTPTVQQTEIDTPSKKSRGRPRKNPNFSPTVDDTNDLSRRTQTRTHSPPPEEETIVVAEPPVLSSSPSSPVVEGRGQGRVTRSQAASSKGTG